MNIGNITSNGMNLTENGRFMQIELYEKEIERLQNIIKEVREYIEEHSQMTDLQIYGIENVLSFRGSVEELLEILDKAD